MSAPAARSPHPSQMLAASALALVVCAATWALYGVLLPALCLLGDLTLSPMALGGLLAAPLLTGGLLRAPVSALSARFGGSAVLAALTLTAALAALCVSAAHTAWGFALAGLGLGVAGAGFAAASASVSAWYPRHAQAPALATLGACCVGVAFTAVIAPAALTQLEIWRTLPRLYAAALALVAALLWLRAPNWAQPDARHTLTWARWLRPLRRARAWRFGLYYALTLGGFAALAQWLTPYGVAVYSLSLTQAAALVAALAVAVALGRFAGERLSERWGARAVMGWVLRLIGAAAALLLIEHVSLDLPAQPISARNITSSAHPMTQAPTDCADAGRWHVCRQDAPTATDGGDAAQAPRPITRGVVRVGLWVDAWLFAALVGVVGFALGVGQAAVYKHIPEYFPDEADVVRAWVGALGFFGGGLFAALFGLLLAVTGVWSSAWALLCALSLGCLTWMRAVIRRMQAAHAPIIQRQIDDKAPGEVHTVIARAQRPTHL